MSSWACVHGRGIYSILDWTTLFFVYISQTAFKALGWAIRIRIVLSWVSLRYAGETGWSLAWMNPALTFTYAEEISSSGSMMLLAQALGAFWDRSNLSEITKHEREEFFI